MRKKDTVATHGHSTSTFNIVDQAIQSRTGILAEQLNENGNAEDQ
jgi:hypothetical protein